MKSRLKTKFKIEFHGDIFPNTTLLRGEPDQVKITKINIDFHIEELYFRWCYITIEKSNDSITALK